MAALLAIAEKLFADYGKCKITINDEKEITVDGGKPLLSSLGGEKIFLPSACGGRGTCGLCKLKVVLGGGTILPTEEPLLTKEEQKTNFRLSCQLKVKRDLKIQLPDEIFAIKEYLCKCVEIKDLTSDMKQFKLELIEPNSISYTPGQYIQLRTPPYGKNKEEAYRAYSISSDPADKNFIELIIRLVPGGICTTYCFEHLKVGDEVKINGPYGQFRLTETDAPIVFVAGGSGMAPIKCMLHYMKNTGNKRHAVYYFGANKVNELVCSELMKKFESDLPNFKFVPVVSNPQEKWDGQRGLVTDAVKQNLKDAPQYEAYFCGSPGMIDALVKLFKEFGTGEDKIFYDKFE